MQVVETGTALSQIAVCGEGAAPGSEGAKRCARILSVSPYHFDHNILHEILNGSHWHLVTAYSWLEAVERLGKDAYLAVFCEYAWANRTWRDLLHKVSTSQGLPILVVMSRSADEDLWANVIELGAYDLLEKPLNVRDVLDVLMSACHYRTGPRG